ncbi:MAG: hypothetical protein ACK4PR_09585, partial [Gammaproteobacteria bacterium]
NYILEIAYMDKAAFTAGFSTVLKRLRDLYKKDSGSFLHQWLNQELLQTAYARSLLFQTTSLNEFKAEFDGMVSNKQYTIAIEKFLSKNYQHLSDDVNNKRRIEIYKDLARSHPSMRQLFINPTAIASFYIQSNRRHVLFGNGQIVKLNNSNLRSYYDNKTINNIRTFIKKNPYLFQTPIANLHKKLASLKQPAQLTVYIQQILQLESAEFIFGEHSQGEEKEKIITISKPLTSTNGLRLRHSTFYQPVREPLITNQPFNVEYDDDKETETSEICCNWLFNKLKLL